MKKINLSEISQNTDNLIVKNVVENIADNIANNIGDNIGENIIADKLGNLADDDIILLIIIFVLIMESKLDKDLLLCMIYLFLDKDLELGFNFF